ncbi:MAG: ATP-dependent Clp protease ATP-binding subunit [Acutalibacteraceae bacterium]|nr:ATP-dependent Clp protease ATP-binding subunit [Acutalibacteraceae bacterium]
MKQVLCCRCHKNPAVIFISQVNTEKQEPQGYCIKCAMELNIGPVRQIMDNMGVSEDDVDQISDQINAMLGFDENSDFEEGGAPTMPSLETLFNALGNNGVQNQNPEGQGNGENSEYPSVPDTEENDNSHRHGPRKRGQKGDRKKRRFLNLYCTDLTERARKGELDRIIGRDREIERAIQILCRRSKNNPCLIGEPGVGKTAIAEGLAERIASGNVPAKLADKEIHLLDLTALVAGTQFRGQFESRVKGLLEEVEREKNIILFIDEIHNLVGTGDADGTMNAANIMKPALSRGEIQVIGATTFNEYRKHIEKDAALERRFQPIKVEEPSVDETTEILNGIKGYYEDFHRVKISDHLVHEAVVLSERYITDRFLPDKAIDLLDEACTSANLRNKAISECELAEKELADLKQELQDMESDTSNPDYEGQAKLKSDILTLQNKLPALQRAAADNQVTEEDIGKVIQLWTGVPASKVIESDLKKLANLESELKKKVIGQDDAIHAVAQAVKRSRIQINARRRPASFIFVGPTGVGKTELVKQLANQLFDTPETLIRLDMSEFMEKFSVSRIIGSPPGYVGYDEAGQLTEKVRRKPYSVILFDEIEKAHPDVMNILLQILDEGKINDAQGRTVNFENTIIVMTSNAGSNTKDTTLGFNKNAETASKDHAMKALREFLRPEFIGRVDEVVVFNDLTDDNYDKIAELMLGELKEPLADKGITLTWDDGVPAEIRKRMDSHVRGARDLRNVIRRSIEDKIADMIIDADGAPVTAISITSEDGEIVLHKN